MTTGELFAEVADVAQVVRERAAGVEPFLVPGNTLAGSTTLAQLLDATYPNRSGNLTAASAVFTVVSPQLVNAGWAATGSLVRIALEKRPLTPDTIDFAGAPSVTSLSPSTGLHATVIAITIAGTGFQTGATVSFGGTVVTPTTVTATSIAVSTAVGTIPAAGTVQVWVINPDQQLSNQSPFVAT